MTSVFERKNRRVLPNWRSFEVTANLGELNDWRSERKKQSSYRPSIEDYLRAWKNNRTIPIAGDLLSSALVNGFTENTLVKEAASFILADSSKSVTVPLRKLARSLINPTIDAPETMLVLDRVEDCFESENIHRLIRITKAQLSKFPLNAILYVELARLYSILGNKEKALRNMSVALHLTPENRFILRSASRLYTHFDLPDHIYSVIRKNSLVNYDPWITSTEIALATIIGQSPRSVKRGLEMIKSGNYSSSSLTELASSIGTLEFLNGNRKQTKRLFEKALISPNDNTLAQAEWVSGEVDWFEINPASFHVKNNYEALALDNYNNQKWHEALENSAYWFCDLPFSKWPIMLGWHIADSLLDKRETGRLFLKAGLVSHPNDPQILNNLAYSFALENEVNEAETYLDRIQDLSRLNRITKICVTATKGLISFRKGLQDEGRNLYFDAIKETNAIKDRYLYSAAILNYAREEILSSSDRLDSLFDIIDTFPEDPKHPDITKLKNDIIALRQQAQVR